jgi:hypothetical protein
MKYPSLALVVLSGSLLFSCIEESKAQILLNGGFESPALPTNTASVTGAGTAWTPSVLTSAISTFQDSTATSNGVGNSPYGTQFLELSSGTSVSQINILGFVQGDTYVLGADFANTDSTANSNFTMAISGAAGSTSQTFAAPAGGSYGTSTIPFYSGVIVFTASASGAATITLSDPLGGGDLAVDNVALYGLPPGMTITNATPEPSTWALLFGGLSVLAFWQLRRSRA